MKRLMHVGNQSTTYFNAVRRFSSGAFDARIRFHGVLAPNAKLRALVVPHGPEQATGKSEQTASEPGCAHSRPVRISWARLLKRVFQIDLEHCPNCGGELKIIAAILAAPVIERILTHLGLQARAPPRVPARRDLQQAA